MGFQDPKHKEYSQFKKKKKKKREREYIVDSGALGT